MGLVVDLLLSENPALRTDPAAAPCFYVFCTDAHNDHICDAFTLASLPCAALVATYEPADPFAAQGVPAPDLMPGSGVDLQRGRIQMMATAHRSPSIRRRQNPVHQRRQGLLDQSRRRHALLRRRHHGPQSAPAPCHAVQVLVAGASLDL